MFGYFETIGHPPPCCFCGAVLEVCNYCDFSITSGVVSLCSSIKLVIEPGLTIDLCGFTNTVDVFATKTLDLKVKEELFIKVKKIGGVHNIHRQIFLKCTSNSF